MATLAKNIDYTDRDFDSLLVRLKLLIQSCFPNWTDFEVANFGNLLLELFSFVGDVIGFNQDNAVRECYFPTATQRRSMLALARLVGYTPSGAAAARADVTFTLAATTAGSVTFPTATIVKTKQVTDPVKTQLLASVTIPAGSLSAAGVVEHSSSAEESFTASGLPNQDVILSETPYLDDSAVVIAANGAYTQVDNFLSSTATDRHFVVTVDQNDRATLRFGNGVNGVLPVGTITVAYKTGGGAAGNVDPGTLTVLETSFIDSLGNPVKVSVTNPAKAQGGVNRETIEQIRVAAPPANRTGRRTVTREDFEINAKRLTSVARALMLSSNEDVSIPENSGILYIVPVGGGTASEFIKADVRDQFEASTKYPKTITFQLDVQTAIYKTINVSGTVFLKAGSNAAAAKQAIEKALTDHFAIQLSDGSPNPLVDFGFYFKDGLGEPSNQIPWSDIFNAVRDVSFVRKVQPDDFFLNGARADVSIALREFPILGTVTLVNGDTGNPL